MNNDEDTISEMIDAVLDRYDAATDEILELAKKLGLNVELPDGEDG